MEFWESYKSKSFNFIYLILFKRCMAFDGRTDPNNGYEEKSPCTVIVLEFGCEQAKIFALMGGSCKLYNLKNN
jgi:hypothetical protein